MIYFIVNFKDGSHERLLVSSFLYLKKYLLLKSSDSVLKIYLKDIESFFVEYEKQ